MDHQSPLVSVIVPTFNRPQMLIKALNSILNQTYKNIEVIVINDAGDDVGSLINSINQSDKVVYIKQLVNKERSATRNTGIKIAKGKYIAYLDDDDTFYPDHVETLVNFLETTDYRVAYTDACRAHQVKVDGEYLVTKRDVPHSRDFDYDAILNANFIPILCIMHEKICLDEVGCFDEALITLEDWDLWMRMSRRFKFGHIKKITCEFSWRTDGSSTTSGRTEQMTSDAKLVSERGRHYNYEQQSENNQIYQGIHQLIASGRYEEAVVSLEKMLETFPNYALAHNDLGVLYWNKGDKWKALMYFNEALRFHPNNIYFLINYAKFYYATGQAKVALEIYLKMLKKQPFVALKIICSAHGRWLLGNQPISMLGNLK